MHYDRATTGIDLSGYRRAGTHLIAAPWPSPFVAIFSNARKARASGAFGVRRRLVFDRENFQINRRIDKPITEGASSTVNRPRRN